jgi:hypothetical protein
MFGLLCVPVWLGRVEIKAFVLNVPVPEQGYFHIEAWDLRAHLILLV